jgi:hypothetical protein
MNSSCLLIAAIDAAKLLRDNRPEVAGKGKVAGVYDIVWRLLFPDFTNAKVCKVCIQVDLSL